MTEFSIDLGGLPSGPSRVRLEAPVHDLDLSDSEWTGRVVGDLDVERNADRISIRGKLEALVKVECVRCLAPFELLVEAPFEIFAERSGTGRRFEEKELERDDYMLFHDGRRLELSGQAREALLLELPVAPRCREDCRGLCARCGVDLNQEPCRCEGSKASAAG